MSDVSENAGRDQLVRILPFKDRRPVRRRNSFAFTPQKDDTPYNEDDGYHKQKPRNDLLYWNRKHEPVRSIDDDQCEDGLESEKTWEPV